MPFYPNGEYDPNEKLELIIQMMDDKGEQTMRIRYESIDIVRITNLIQVFTAGRYDKDARMTIDIAYPVNNEHQALPKV